MSSNNLIPQAHKLTAADRAKGGKRSAEARLVKRQLKECMTELLSLPVQKQKEWNKLIRMGLAPENIDNRYLIVVSLFQKAVNGDIAAFKEIRGLIGEKETTAEDIDRLDKVLEKIEGNI